MFSETAELYDLIYGQFKDYEDETRRIAELLRRVHPGAETVLDVGCGTGEHARLLAALGYRVDGVDIDPTFVRLAEEKHPEGRFVRADMAELDLGRRYDAVLCLFSSIGYVRTLEAVERTLAGFRAHLAPGGVVVVEPWLEPDAWFPGSVYLVSAETEEVKVCRMSHATRQGSLSILELRYLVGRESGIEHLREVHELGLFTREEMGRCFASAGLRVVEYDAEGLMGRGLFVAREAEPASPPRPGDDASAD